ncbi:ACT domain-containing protein [Dysosmobacter sp.]|uniref:ACT domain-containing protein n=1 Tax=Dysosmobacter sp. TaxID=2591382 RepID=UPI002A967FF9|nr:ACT domain-containing protein [Dysosmobacter sp.]MDY5612591.1 ACT domain-containing protein [Dysosmobacter sp.]
MNAIVTVIGWDRVGIIAAVCALLAENNVNILDISQTILQGSFTMVMAVDVGAATASFGDLSAALEELGSEMGLSIRIQRQEIFDAMHQI